MEEQFELIAKTFQGLEEVLAQEITELGANNVQIGRRMVSFSGDKEMMYRANFCLRTAVRVLKPIKHFKAKDADEVYNAVKDIDWGQYLDLDTAFAVDSVVYSEEFRHSKFVAYKVKDAIVDYFREKTGKRPNIRITNPDIKLNIHIAETDCTLSLDSSGDSLHMRGYRVASVEAPINEVLAAALVKLSGWKYDMDLIDPFCGSGTILIEAALMAKNIYPGVFRKSFGFEKWKDFDSALLDRIYNDDSQEREFNHKIYGYDLNFKAIDAATLNVKSAGMADCIVLKQQDFKKFEQPAEKSIIITNPPYGERLVSPDLLSTYRTIGDRLKHQFVGNDAWIISSKEELFDEVGLAPSIRIPLFNGALDCDFRKYQIFDGKFNDFRANGGDIKTPEERSRMAEKKRFKQNREFKERSDFGENDSAEEDAIPGYLLRRHRDFEQAQQRRQHRDERQRDNSYGRRDDRDRRGSYGGGKRFRDGEGRDGGGYRRDREDGDRQYRGGSRFNREGDSGNRYDRGNGDRRRGDRFDGGRGERRYGRDDDSRRFDRGNRFDRGGNRRDRGGRYGSDDSDN